MIEADKFKHIIVSTAIALVCPLLAVIAGIVKEWLDEKRGGKWDWFDILADLLGVALGWSVHTIIAEAVGVWSLGHFVPM